jgi:hypothetical protein
MHPSDLEFFTCQELVNELMRRPSFLGVVVHSAQDAKGKGWTGQPTFQVRFNSNLSLNEACRLLTAVTDRMSPRDE